MSAVGTVFEGAAEAGWQDRTVYIDDGTNYTFGETERLVRRSMAALQAIGVVPGDTVILRSADTLDLVVTLLAVQAIGTIAMPTCIQLCADDLVYRADDTDAKFLISIPQFLDEALAAGIACGGATEVISHPADTEGRCLNIADYLPDDDTDVAYADTDAEDLCLLFLYVRHHGRAERDLLLSPRYAGGQRYLSALLPLPPGRMTFSAVHRRSRLRWASACSSIFPCGSAMPPCSSLINPQKRRWS